MARLLVDEQALINRLRQDDMVAMLQPKPRLAVPARCRAPRQDLRQVPKVARRVAGPRRGGGAAARRMPSAGCVLRPPSADSAIRPPPSPVAVLKEDRRCRLEGCLARARQLAGPRHASSSNPAWPPSNSPAVPACCSKAPPNWNSSPAWRPSAAAENCAPMCRRPPMASPSSRPSSRVVDLGTTFGLSVRE